MIRFILVVMGLGGFLIFKAYQDFTIASGSTTQPEAIALATLEDAGAVENNHIEIGPHVQVFPELIYSYKAKGSVNDSTRVEYAYYPIISKDDPFVAKLDAIEARYGDDGDVPDEEWPTLETITVLVKTTRFKTVGALPEGLGSAESVRGMVISEIEPLDSEESALITSSFPSVDPQKVIILEERRKPQSMGFLAGEAAAGVALFFAPLAFFLWRRRRASLVPATQG